MQRRAVLLTLQRHAIRIASMRLKYNEYKWMHQCRFYNIERSVQSQIFLNREKSYSTDVNVNRVTRTIDMEAIHLTRMTTPSDKYIKICNEIIQENQQNMLWIESPSTSASLPWEKAIQTRIKHQDIHGFQSIMQVFNAMNHTHPYIKEIWLDILNILLTPSCEAFLCKYDPSMVIKANQLDNHYIFQQLDTLRDTIGVDLVSKILIQLIEQQIKKKKIRMTEELVIYHSLLSEKIVLPPNIINYLFACTGYGKVQSVDVVHLATKLFNITTIPPFQYTPQTFAKLFQAASKHNKLQQIHLDMFYRWHEAMNSSIGYNTYKSSRKIVWEGVYGALLNCLIKLKKYQEAIDVYRFIRSQKYFDKLKLDENIFNNVFVACRHTQDVTLGRFSHIIYKDMRQFVPLDQINTAGFSAAIAVAHAQCNADMMREIMQDVHEKMEQSNFTWALEHTELYNAALVCFNNAQEVEWAKELTIDMNQNFLLKPCVQTLQAYVQMHRPSVSIMDTLNDLASFQTDGGNFVLPDCRVFTSLLQKCAKSPLTDLEEKKKEASQLWKWMKQMNAKPDLQAFTVLLRIYAANDYSDFENCDFILQEMKQMRKEGVDLQIDSVFANTLMRGLLNAGGIEHCYAFLQYLPKVIDDETYEVKSKISTEVSEAFIRILLDQAQRLSTFEEEEEEDEEGDEDEDEDEEEEEETSDLQESEYLQSRTDYYEPEEYVIQAIKFAYNMECDASCGPISLETLYNLIQACQSSESLDAMLQTFELLHGVDLSTSRNKPNPPYPEDMYTELAKKIHLYYGFLKKPQSLKLVESLAKRVGYTDWDGNTINDINE